MDGWDGVAVGDPGEARPCHLIDSHFHLGTWDLGLGTWDLGEHSFVAG
jgi:hypothetical protein